jgi:hypothetical protein
MSRRLGLTLVWSAIVGPLLGCIGLIAALFLEFLSSSTNDVTVAEDIINDLPETLLTYAKWMYPLFIAQSLANGLAFHWIGHKREILPFWSVFPVLALFFVLAGVIAIYEFSDPLGPVHGFSFFLTNAVVFSHSIMAIGLWLIMRRWYKVSKS